jgi:5-formyltetrahydrofolate cyclo-ligase
MKPAKADIRKQIRNGFLSFSEKEKKRQSDIIFNKIESLPEFLTAKTILVFWSLPDEVITFNFIQKWHQQKTILLPCVQENDIHLKIFDGTESMHLGTFNISEPQGEYFTNVSVIDLGIIPGLAFDKQGNRLGRGKGYYDRFLPKLLSPKIGICYDFQFIENIPSDHWDIKMDMVITG